MATQRLHPHRTQPLRLASAIERMPRDRAERSLAAAAIAASLIGLLLAVANYLT